MMDDYLDKSRVRPAEGELVVIPSLPSELLICLRGLYEKFEIVDEVTGGGI